MDKKKILKYTVVVLLILSVSGYYLYQHALDIGLEKPALVLTVSTNLTDKGTPIINNVTFEESSVMFFYKRADTPANFPEIDANARINKLAAIPASFWASIHRPSEGVYTLRMFFRDGMEPKKGDVLIIPIRLVSHTGAIQYKTTAFYCWSCEE
ncbi:MAG: hypothetical protein O8C66_08440 [Candidatus Methanoperedens sp.]|nr:hypothetical protein [Candidatus Methanoperedens sp.]MCZ7370525.1 hypothetical protein [Candidatus Methanoperedens sp.]